jgi:hypothetical protein
VPTVAYTHNAEDNLIVHGDAFANWTLDANSSKSAAGIVLTQTGTSDNAIIDIAGLTAATEYWMKITVDAKSAGMNGNARLVAIDDTGCEIAGTTGALLNFGASGNLGTFYGKVKTKATSAQPGLFRMVIKHATSPDTNWLRMSAIALYPIPARSSAKIAVLGDRTASYNATVAGQVDTAILAAAGDNVNVIAPGDLSDGSNAIAATNDSLRNALILKGGNLYAAPGNWDYAAGIAAWETYFGISDTYRSVVLGECEIFFYDSNDAHADNSQASVAAAQAAPMGQWLLAAIAASTARWKIVVVHYPPYTSSTHHGGPSNNGTYAATTPSAACMQWDFAALGVPLVIQSHDHVISRMLVNETFYYTFALGGGAANSFGTPLPESQYRSTTAGYLKIHDSTDALILEHFSTSNLLLDRVKISAVTIPDPEPEPDEEEFGGSTHQFENILWAEGVATTTAVRAAFKVATVQATGGRGARVIVPESTSIKSSMAQDTRAKGITNPSQEELEALLLVL